VIIRKLVIENLRNLGRVKIEPHAQMNYLCGNNGAGKTSVLEAIAVLSRGRSFRTVQASELAGPQGPTYRVFAELIDESKNLHKAGLERAGSHWRARINGEEVQQLSRLSRKLPSVLMVPDSHQLVSGPPENRRRYLDWGLFHVEHAFLEEMRRFSKALKQRNAALRGGRLDSLDGLDDVLARSGEQISEYRKVFTKRISDKLGRVLEALNARVNSIEITYQTGWNTDTYMESMLARRGRDLERGVTSTGPHRAELLFICNGAPAKAVLSRGEQKAFAAALLLTQVELLLESGIKPVLLLDDLVSEFDREHFLAVLERVRSTGVQTWITGTTDPSLEADRKMFHVEQGTVLEMV
jgi:DNA replication and repair protein RecF